ncbi:hypothetical protein TIFTF001_028217 [Ficus carica]|uniref:Uncharacterized protein n=1 Tax=Ficus carica TaxID=3494 RepID=A0AA88DPE2_FICCA|nr:hypothetical protein TIFTF001_028217 [Ficus carica]
MFTNSYDKNKTKVGFGLWFELDWASRPNHSIVARHDIKVVLVERKLTSYVYAVGKQPSGNL